MKRFFVQLESGDRDLETIVRALSSIGEVHIVLGTLYVLSTEQNYNTVSLRDTILHDAENSRVFILEIDKPVNAAWRLTLENSDWIKTIL